GCALPPAAGPKRLGRRNYRPLEESWFCRAIRREISEAWDRDRSWASRRAKRPRHLRVGGRQKRTKTNERDGDSAKKRKSIGEESSRTAAGRKHVCPNRHAAINDA